MKKIVTTLTALLLTLYSFSQCKPDYDKTDKIDNTPNKMWEVRLGSLGFGKSFFAKDKDWTVYLKFTRTKNQNFITFMVMQVFGQNEIAQADKFWAGKNMELALAFENSSPVKFQSQIPQIKNTKALGMISHEVHLTQVLNDEKFEELYNAFQKSTPSAFRVVLAGEQIEKSLRDGKAEKIKEKFLCFYAYNKEAPVPLAKDLSISKEFVLDPNTNKYSFTEVVSISKSQKELFQNAKSWLVQKNIDKKVNYENEAEGKLIASGVYKKTYNTNNLVSEDVYTYNATISVKEGKYKYDITDISIDDGKMKFTMEALLEQLKSRADLLESGMVELKGNIDKIIGSLKSDMKGTSDEW